MDGDSGHFRPDPGTWDEKSVRFPVRAKSPLIQGTWKVDFTVQKSVFFLYVLPAFWTKMSQNCRFLTTFGPEMSQNWQFPDFKTFLIFTDTRTRAKERVRNTWKRAKKEITSKAWFPSPVHLARKRDLTQKSQNRLIYQILSEISKESARPPWFFWRNDPKSGNSRPKSGNSRPKSGNSRPTSQKNQGKVSNNTVSGMANSTVSGMANSTVSGMAFVWFLHRVWHGFCVISAPCLAGSFCSFGTVSGRVIFLLIWHRVWHVPFGPSCTVSGMAFFGPSCTVSGMVFCTVPGMVFCTVSGMVPVPLSGMVPYHCLAWSRTPHMPMWYAPRPYLCDRLAVPRYTARCCTSGCTLMAHRGADPVAKLSTRLDWLLWQTNLPHLV